jgi:hypothetical protein
MALTITDKSTLKTLFSQMSRVIYIPTPNLADPAKETGACLDLPILEDSVTFKSGEVTTTKVKLINGELWDSIPKMGDADMSMQIGTLNDAILSLFCTKAATELTAVAFDGFTYAGSGYNFDIKKVSGGLFMENSDKTEAIWLPNVSMYGSVQMDNAKPSYINVKFDALESTLTGAGAIYVLAGTKTAG